MAETFVTLAFAASARVDGRDVYTVFRVRHHQLQRMSSRPDCKLHSVP